MAKSEKTFEDAYRFVTMVAQHNGWELNSDKEFLEDLVSGLRTNFNRYGYYLCPCRDGSGDREKDRDIICPCDYNVPDQKEYGHCFCALYFRKGFFAEGNRPQPIPERRPEHLQLD
ncbi:MAG: ferredoxin-thioredoxin reductase catalytic domain-containing protein [Spirochaetota bacterium]